MEENLEQKLIEAEVSINLFRRHLLSSQALKSILINLYNLLESEEENKEIKCPKKKNYD